MPSPFHEALIELFRRRPSLAAELLAGPHGVVVPEWYRARLDSAELTEVTPTEYRADAVVTLVDAGDTPVLAVVVEVQLGRDSDKRWSWPAYVGTLRARLRCLMSCSRRCPQRRSTTWRH